MNRVRFFFAASLITILAAAEPSAFDIVKAGEDRMRGETAFTRLTITIEKPRLKRNLTLESWESRKADKSFIRILEPKKDAGVTFLKLGSNLWQYIPHIGREVKIEESLMHDSWMGSDFTNDDLVKRSSVTEDYNHSFAAGYKDEKLHQIVMIPKPKATVVWGKIISFVRKSDLLPERQELYDHKMRLVRVLVLSDFRTIGGRFLPAQMEMSTIHEGKAKSKTTMRYLKAEFDRPIGEKIFSKANLRR